MKRFVIAAAATALSTTAVFAAMSMGDVDTDGDNFASMAEIAAAYPGFNQIEFNNIDVNSDSRISNDELLKPESQAILTRYEMNEQGGSSMVMADANGDGFVSLEELTAAIPGFIKQDFDDIDINSDNRLSADEMDTGEAATIFARSSAPDNSMDLMSLDADGDNFLTFEELSVGYPNLPELEFKNIDTNNDSRLDSSELQAPDAVTTLGSY